MLCSNVWSTTALKPTPLTTSKDSSVVHELRFCCAEQCAIQINAAVNQLSCVTIARLARVVGGGKLTGELRQRTTRNSRLFSVGRL